MGAMYMAIKKRHLASAAVPAKNAWNDEGDKHDFPNLFSFLRDTKYDNGDARTPGAVSIFTSQGVLKACLNDKDQLATAFVEAATLHELIEVIERAICDDCTEWKINPNVKKPTF